MASVISLKGLTKVYGDKRVVDNFSLDVEKGHIYGLIGPNGAGKTTIMKMIAGLIDPAEGEIELFGQEFYSQREYGVHQPAQGSGRFI